MSIFISIYIYKFDINVFTHRYIYKDIYIYVCTYICMAAPSLIRPPLFLGVSVCAQTQVYTREALFLLEEGALPHQIDAALESWGMAMGN